MIVGITGGIGSGKTICAEIFEELEIPVYYSDQRAKELMVTDLNLITSIKLLFGEESYTEDGRLNRKYIAGLIFNDESMLKEMNKLVHPAVRADFLNWGRQQLKSAPYIMQESALLYETGSYRLFDKVIVVDAPIDIRIRRVMERDSVTEEQVLARMSKQLPSEEKREKADYIIENDGRHSIIRQIIEIHMDLLSNKNS